MKEGLNRAGIAEQIAKSAEAAANAQKHSEFNRTIIIAIMTVLFIGFAGVFIAATSMLIDSFRSKSASYESLTNKINDQNNKIDILTREIDRIGVGQQIITPNAQGKEDVVK